ncbi:MAG: hypothetical protein FWG65_08375 [Turicibacter sp.]|nr:hypothetical protein [Turicibacter sp.]
MKNTKKTFLIPLIVAIVAIVIVTYSPLAAFRQSDNTAFTTELEARQNTVINFAKTWTTEELGLDLQTQQISFTARLNLNALTTNTQSEIWRVEITNPTITRRNSPSVTGRIATLDIDRITGNITVIGTSFREQEIYVNGANIIITNLTAIRTAFPEREYYVYGANRTIAEIMTLRAQWFENGMTWPAVELYDITEVAAIVASEITQKFDINLDGASFIVALVGDFWSINVLLNPEQVLIGELPHIIPKFHALFDFTDNSIVSLTDF